MIDLFKHPRPDRVHLWDESETQEIARDEADDWKPQPRPWWPLVVVVAGVVVLIVVLLLYA